VELLLQSNCGAAALVAKWLPMTKRRRMKCWLQAIVATLRDADAMLFLFRGSEDF
jgi:hypothetical protein